MLKKILGVVAAIVIALVIVITTRPDSYRVERSVTAKAPAEVVYAHLSDFNHFEAWSPWAKLDPAMKKDIKGVGLGATYHWSGNDDVGEGHMAITAAESPSKIDMSLEFVRPFASKAETGFVITPEGEGSKITWWMTGHNNFMSKAFGLFVNMEEMIGKDYEKGLAALKPLVEAEAEQAAKAEAMAAPAPEGEAAAPEGEAAPQEATP